MRAIKYVSKADVSMLRSLKQRFWKPRLRNRTELLNYLAKRFNYESYLEIGCSSGKNFNKIDISLKVGVDPKQGGTFRGTSDEFFAMNHARFDLIFIDGLHHAKQVLRDVDNSLRVLQKRGAIVLHDCNPLSEEAQRVPRPQSGGIWNGDVWRATLALRTRHDLDVAMGDFDHGCCLVLVRRNTDPLMLDEDPFAVGYEACARNRGSWLRLLTPSQLLRFLRSY